MKKLMSIILSLTLLISVFIPVYAEAPAAEAPEAATLYLSKNFQIAEVDQRLFGGFLEPIGNIVYGGVYDPNHPTADEQGFRQDVIDLMKDLGVTVIRYPGGNFVSNYHWLDGVGDVASRPARIDKAWGTVEPNTIGLHEYYDWIKKIGAEPMLAVNLGTGSPEEAANEVEYLNHEGGTYYSDLRKANGQIDPQAIALWCLGNEMDGSWQIGEKTSFEYGRIAYEAAKQMKAIDPTIELVLAGSSANNTGMKTYGYWDYEVFDEAYNSVDYISIHRYVSYDPQIAAWIGQPGMWTIEELPLISGTIDEFITTITAAADLTKGKLHSDNVVDISFDEWGIYSGLINPPEELGWTEQGWGGNLVDAVVTGSLLMTFINRADRVKIAANSIIIGTLVGTTENAYATSMYYPFQMIAKNAQGVALRQSVKSPQLATTEGDRDAIQTAAVYNEETGELNVFVANLDIHNEIKFNLLTDFDDLKFVEHVVMTDSQPLAVNSQENPLRLVPKNVEDDEQATEFTLEPLSFHLLKFKV